MFQFLALHRTSNGPWTKQPLSERTMSRFPAAPTRYILRLWAAGLREDEEKEVNKLISGHPKFLSEPMLSFSQHPPAANEIV